MWLVCRVSSVALREDPIDVKLHRRRPECTCRYHPVAPSNGTTTKSPLSSKMSLHSLRNTTVARRRRSAREHANFTCNFSGSQRYDATPPAAFFSIVFLSPRACLLFCLVHRATMSICSYGAITREEFWRLIVGRRAPAACCARRYLAHGKVV